MATKRKSTSTTDAVLEIYKALNDRYLLRIGTNTESVIRRICEQTDVIKQYLVEKKIEAVENKLDRMKKYRVRLYQVFDDWETVEAPSKDEAMKIVRKEFCGGHHQIGIHSIYECEDDA